MIIDRIQRRSGVALLITRMEALFFPMSLLLYLSLVDANLFHPSGVNVLCFSFVIFLFEQTQDVRIYTSCDKASYRV